MAPSGSSLTSTAPGKENPCSNLHKHPGGTKVLLGYPLFHGIIHASLMGGRGVPTLRSHYSLFPIPIPCLFKFLRTFLHLRKSQLFSFHGIAHSSTQKKQGWGTPTVSTLTPARIAKSGPKPGAASHRPAPTLSALRITSHQSLRTLSCNQQVLREGPFAVDPLAIAAESRARGHLWNFFGSVLVRAFRPNRFVFL